MSCSLAVALAVSPAAQEVVSTPSSNVFGGAKVGACGWPTVVGLLIQTPTGGRSFCSGTLVAPDIVLYAGHCGAQVTAIGFGEDVRALWYGPIPPGGGSGQPQRTVRPVYCKVDPEFTGRPFIDGHDFAYCKLPTPITDLPIVPIAMGCETAQLRAGQPVTYVGLSSSSSNGTIGLKNAAVGAFQRLDNTGRSGVDLLLSRGAQAGTCEGDSGGPLMATVAPAPDGAPQWRLIGVLTGAIGSRLVCDSSNDGTAVHQPAWRAVPWIERDAGVDITPCFDASGAWAPDARCRAVPLQPAAGAGAWAPGCGTDTSGWVASCGAPYDVLPTALAIKSPTDGERLLGDDNIDIEIDVTAPGAWLQDETRTRSNTLKLLVDDEPLATQQVSRAPFSFTGVSLPWGTHRLRVTFTDSVGDTVASAPVTVDVPNRPSPFAAHGRRGGTEDAADSDHVTGGCQAAGAASAWVILVLAGAGLLRAAWRRRPRRAKVRR
jgi:hypothetical protein